MCSLCHGCFSRQVTTRPMTAPTSIRNSHQLNRFSKGAAKPPSNGTPKAPVSLSRQAPRRCQCTLSISRQASADNQRLRQTARGPIVCKRLRRIGCRSPPAGYSRECWARQALAWAVRCARQRTPSAPVWHSGFPTHPTPELSPLAPRNYGFRIVPVLQAVNTPRRLPRGCAFGGRVLETRWRETSHLPLDAIGGGDGSILGRAGGPLAAILLFIAGVRVIRQVPPPSRPSTP